jgi:hypothetical protein
MLVTNEFISIPGIPALYASKFARKLNYHFELGQATLKSQLDYYIENFDANFSLTFDGWTATEHKNRAKYIGITIHFIDKNWVLNSKILDMVIEKEKESGECYRPGRTLGGQLWLGPAPARPAPEPGAQKCKPRDPSGSRALASSGSEPPPSTGATSTGRGI